MKRMSLTLLMTAASAGPVMAVDIQLTVRDAVSGDSALTVGPGDLVYYEIEGLLSNDTEGLALIALDLDFSGGPLTPTSAPRGRPSAANPMAAFNAPHGYTNPEGFGGIVDNGGLRMVGGGQNTINNSTVAIPTGTVIEGVALTPTVLVSGSLTAPSSPGIYELEITDVVANAILANETGPVYGVRPILDATITNLTLSVTTSCSTFADCADGDGDGIRDDPCLW